MDVDNIIRLFSLNSPVSIDIKNTSHGDDDFRETFIVNFGIEKIVIKLSANGFTDEKHLILWERIAKEYLNTEQVDRDTVIGFRHILEIIQTCDSAAYTTMGITRASNGVKYRNHGSFNESFDTFKGFTGRRAKLVSHQ